MVRIAVGGVATGVDLEQFPEVGMQITVAVMVMKLYNGSHRYDSQKQYGY